MHDLRQSFDSKAGYYQRVAGNFARDNGEYRTNALDFVGDLGGEALNHATRSILPGPLNDVVWSLTDSVISASDGPNWFTLGHLTLATYNIKNLAQPSGSFAGISKYGGGALLWGGIAIKGYEHFGSTIYNEWQQGSIMQAGHDELDSLRSQYSTEEYHVGKFQEEYKAKGCDNL